MRFQVEQKIAGPVEAVANIYTDPRFYEAAGELPKLGRPEVLDRREDGPVVHLAVRFRFTGNLSSAVTKVVDPAKLTWVEESVHNLADHTVTFRMNPDHYADRLRSEGSVRYEADGAGMTRRLTEGELAVKVPLLLGGGKVGGAVENAIVSGLRDHLAARRPRLRRSGGERDRLRPPGPPCRR
ncbi:MAG TPA: DUF2505 family protein, partial [Acidimicrobiia bacterium]|nr:DUF2505 family protein [Acidimicrobiia bacterium]